MTKEKKKKVTIMVANINPEVEAPKHRTPSETQGDLGHKDDPRRPNSQDTPRE